MIINKRVKIFSFGVVYSAFLILLILSNNSCGRSWTRSSLKRTSDTLSFVDLPKAVVETYEAFFKSGDHPQYLTTDSSAIHVEEFVVINPDFPSLGWKYGFYFKINGKKAFVKFYPMKGRPFIIDQKYIYWSTDINILVQSYREITYVRVPWHS